MGALLTAHTSLAQCCGGWSRCLPKADPPQEQVAPAAKAQTTCPVMGGKVNKTLYADVKGYRVYVCCKACIAAVKAEPEKYLAKVREKGETPEPLTCPKCGAAKGSKKCCAAGKKTDEAEEG